MAQAPKINKTHEFWVTNISQNKDVMLGDLRITVRKGQTMNLLGTKSTYTLAQLEKSAENGSIKIKSAMIKVRNNPPQIPVPPGLHISTSGRFHKPLRSQVKIVEKKFEELDIDMKIHEEQFAAEEAEAAANPDKPKEQYKKLDEYFDDEDDIE